MKIEAALDEEAQADSAADGDGLSRIAVGVCYIVENKGRRADGQRSDTRTADA